jgi:uracil-DNA glycosylase
MRKGNAEQLSTTDLVRRYLSQQRELYGDRLWMEQSKPDVQDAPAVQPDTPKENIVPYRFKPPYKTLDVLEKDINTCNQCSLGATRTKFVFGVGNPNAKMLIIGEAPGRDEDMQGEPFVGRAGKLLDKILAAIELSREDVYIANILKCRPPGNRNPEPAEVEKCEPHLHEQIRAINPKIILALGRVAACNLLKNKLALKDMRARVLEYEGRKLVVTYHPAALLRNPNFKRPAWEDVQMAKKLYDEEGDE